MFQERCQSAFHLLDKGSDTGGVLSEDDILLSGETVSEVLRNKHPTHQGIVQEALCSSHIPPPLPDSIIYECIDADLIRHAATNERLTYGDVCVAPSKRCLMICAFLWPFLCAQNLSIPLS